MKQNADLISDTNYSFGIQCENVLKHCVFAIKLLLWTHCGAL